MVILTIALLLTTISAISISILIFSKGPENKEKLAWRNYSFFIGSWSLFLSLSFHASNYELALFWARAANLSALFIPVAFYQFITHFLNIYPQHQKRIHAIYLFNFCLTIFAILKPEIFIPSLSQKLNISYYSNPSILYHLFATSFFILVTYCHYLLIQELFKKSTPQKQNQIKIIIIGTLVGYIGGGSSFLLIYNIPVYPIGFYGVPIYFLMVSYAIIKHNLMDIRIVIEKSLIYTLTITALSIIYLMAIFILENLAQQLFNYSSILIQVSVAFILGLIFTPLHQIVQKLLERTIFQGSTIEIAAQNELLRREVADKEKFKAIATLASGMAHEVKNPLTAIKTFTEYLPQRKYDPEFLDKFSQIIGAEVNRIDATIHQLLDFAKPAPLTLKETDLHKLINETLSLLNNQFISKKINIEFIPLSDNPLMISIDPNQIRQVLLNLLLNALEATHNGGKITITTSFLSNPLNIQIAVSDTGCGISLEDLKHIFDPFFTKKSGGTGLGLAICYQIISEHNGKINVESAVNQGTTFKITLPI